MSIFPKFSSLLAHFNKKKILTQALIIKSNKNFSNAYGFVWKDDQVLRFTWFCRRASVLLLLKEMSCKCSPIGDAPENLSYWKLVYAKEKETVENHGCHIVYGKSPTWKTGTINQLHMHVLTHRGPIFNIKSSSPPSSPWNS